MRFLAALLAAVATTVALGACGKKHAASPASVTSACTTKIPVQLLPTWARTGFSDPKPHMPFVLGAKGQIGAIVWGNPLLAPPAQDRSNKILWVSHAPFKPGGGDLSIGAQRFEGGKAVGSPLSRSVTGGPGPSLIDLPAGCWHLTLSWWGHTDTMDLEYSPAGKT